MLSLTVRSCTSGRDLVPFLGKWTGSFTVDRVREGADTAENRKRWSLNGFVVIYATGHKFDLNLTGEQETLDFRGVWTRKGRRLTLKVTTTDFDDMGGADARNPNAKFISGPDVLAAYAHPFTLDLSADKLRLLGLTMTMGPTIGHHTFAKDSVSTSNY